MSKRWVCFFSRTGSEIIEVSRRAGIRPSKIITNKIDLKDVVPEILDLNLIRVSSNPSFEELKCCLEGEKDSLITLNGYLRILPEEICNNYEIYNGHPGLITKYPELKGKDPQRKAFDLKLPTSGSVIHKVVKEVDSGEIILSKEIDIKDNDLDQVYTKLHECSIQLWEKFFNLNC
jgi:folate-dependent phosphoribosylglycinamide formyltransferase PurN